MEPETIFYLVLTFSWVQFFWNTYLNIRQKRTINQHSTLPDQLIGILDDQTFNRTKSYALAQNTFILIQDLVYQVFRLLI
jgi:hypothetical protein